MQNVEPFSVVTLNHFLWQIFPINIKGVAGSLVVLVNWSGAWLISYTFNFLMSWSSSGEDNFSTLAPTNELHIYIRILWKLTSHLFNFISGTFFAYSGFSLLTVLFVEKFVPETKGKTLEQIQACINS